MKKSGQALVESVLIVPFFVLSLHAFFFLHENVLQEFESLRLLRKALTQPPGKEHLTQNENSNFHLEIRSSPATVTANLPDSRISKPYFPIHSLETLFLDKFFKRKRVIIRQEPRSPFFKQPRQGVILTPGILRKQGRKLAISLGLLGLF
jgi:hypothetical protein